VVAVFFVVAVVAVFVVVVVFFVTSSSSSSSCVFVVTAALVVAADVLADFVVVGGRDRARGRAARRRLLGRCRLLFAAAARAQMCPASSDLTYRQKLDRLVVAGSGRSCRSPSYQSFSSFQHGTGADAGAVNRAAWRRADR
jgi:hypothetical protein